MCAGGGVEVGLLLCLVGWLVCFLGVCACFDLFFSCVVWFCCVFSFFLFELIGRGEETAYQLGKTVKQITYELLDYVLI